MSDTTLTLHRILKAPRQLVWECWTDPKHIPHWFVPKPHSVKEVVLDLRPGGRFYTVMHVEGNDYPDDGSVLAFEEGTRLVFTDMLLPDWQPNPKPSLGFTGELIFKDHPEGTDYTAIARHMTAESAAAHEKMGFSEGWGTVATQLEEYIQTTLLR